MAVKRKAPAPDNRPYYRVNVKEAVKVHAAMAAGKIALNCAPIDLNAMARWARDAFKDGLTPQSLAWAEENGIEVVEQ